MVRTRSANAHRAEHVVDGWPAARPRAGGGALLDGLREMLPLLERLLMLFNRFIPDMDREKGTDAAPAIAIDILVLFAVMSRAQWSDYMGLQGTNARTDAQRIAFLRRLLQALKRINHECFPQAWVAVQLIATSITLRIIDWVKPLMDQYGRAPCHSAWASKY